MKRILVITPFFYPHIGGSEQYMLGLYTGLKKQSPQVDVDVLCYNTDEVKNREEYKGLNVYRLPCYKILQDQFYIPKPFYLLRFLFSHRSSYDLIHCSTRFFDSSWWGVLFAKITGTKAVLTDHCAFYPVHKSKAVSLIAKLIDSTISNFFLHLFDTVFVENIKTKEFLKSAFGVTSQVCYPGIEKELFSIKKQKEGRLKIVYVGRLIESKGIKTLFDISTVTSGVDFVFAGSGPLLEDLKNDVKKRKLQNVFVLGKINREETVALLKDADIFAYPTWHSEGLPIALLEAGASGVAVVATNEGGISEVIKNNVTGLLVEPKDIPAFKKAIDRLISDPKLRLTFGKNLQELVKEKFTWDKAIKEVNKYL